MDLPKEEFELESSDVIINAQQTFTKAFLLSEDESFLYKKVENFAILKFAVTPRPGFNVDTTDVSFGFIMKTSSLRAKIEPFEMSVPMFINIGRVKRPQAPP